MIIEHVAKTLGGYELVTLSVASRELRRMARIAGRAELRTETERLHALSEHMQRPTNTAASMQPLHLLQSCLKSINTELWADKTGWNWMFRASPSRRVENSASLVIETYDSSSVTLIDLGACPPLRVTIPYRGQAVTTRRTKSFELEDIVMKSFGLSPGWRALVVLTKREHSVHLLTSGSGNPQKSFLIDAVDLPTANHAARVLQRKWTDKALRTDWKLITTPGFKSAGPEAGEWALLYGLYCLSTTSSAATSKLMELQYVFASKGSSTARSGRALFNGPSIGRATSCVPLQLSTGDDDSDARDGQGWYIRFEWPAVRSGKARSSSPRIVQLSLARLLQGTATRGVVDLTAESPDATLSSCDPLAGPSVLPIQQPSHMDQLQPEGSHHVSSDGRCLFTITSTDAESASQLSIRRRDDISQPWPLQPYSTGVDIGERLTIVSSSASRLVLLNSKETEIQILNPQEPARSRVVQLEADSWVKLEVQGDLLLIVHPRHQWIYRLFDLRHHFMSPHTVLDLRTGLLSHTGAPKGQPDESQGASNGITLEKIRSIASDESSGAVVKDVQHVRSRFTSSGSSSSSPGDLQTLWLSQNGSASDLINFCSKAPICDSVLPPLIAHTFGQSIRLVLEPQQDPSMQNVSPTLSRWREVAVPNDRRGKSLLFNVGRDFVPAGELCENSLYLLAPITSVRAYWYRLSLSGLDFIMQLTPTSPLSPSDISHFFYGSENRDAPNYLCWSLRPFAIYLGALRALVHLLAEDDLE